LATFLQEEEVSADSAEAASEAAEPGEAGKILTFMRIFLSILFLSLTALGLSSDINPDTSYITIVFAGDIMGHDAQIMAAYQPGTGTYSYEPTFRYVKPYIENADIAVTNLEVTLAGPPFKGYPRFSSPDNLAVELKNSGFDIVVNANNHALDRGKGGFKRTLTVLDSLNIIHTGTFRNKNERDLNYPLIFEKNSIRIALLNYTYGTNGLKVDTPCIVNRIDTSIIHRDLKKAESASPDYVIVTMHWGIEYERTENTTQQDLATFMLNNGADAIIGSHPHVVQPVRFSYPDKSDSSYFNIIVYSLGNFVSNQRNQYRDGGIIFELTLAKTYSDTRISDYCYMPAWVWVYSEDKTDNSRFYILPVDLFNENEQIFGMSDTDKQKIEKFYNDTRDLLKNIPQSQFYKDYKWKWIKKGQFP
jgi:poly-gamma-glutamate capsule biosynthesis protein CapA/YwtB (metallophosphatase superfamily)